MLASLLMPLSGGRRLQERLAYGQPVEMQSLFCSGNVAPILMDADHQKIGLPSARKSWKSFEAAVERILLLFETPTELRDRGLIYYQQGFKQL